MFFKRLSQWFLSTAVVTLTLLTAACSSAPSAEDVLATVPDNSVVVIRFNLKSVLDNADIQLKDGKYVLSEDLESLMAEIPSGVQTQVEDALKILPAADIENIFFFATEREEWAVTVGINHVDAVEEGLKAELGAPEKDGDFKIFDIDSNLHILLCDNQMWVTNEVNKVKRAVERAKEDNFATYTAATEYLLGDHTVAVTVNMKSVTKLAGDDMPEMLTKYNKDFITFDSKLDGPVITGCLSVMDAEGKCTFPGDFFEEIDTSFLRFVPGNAMVVASVGKPTDKLFNSLGSDFAGSEEISTIKKVDGTSAFTIIPPMGGIENYASSYNWQYLGLTHMPQSDIEEFSNMLAINTGVETNPACQYNYTSPWQMMDIGGNSIFWGNYDGNFAMSSQPITSSNNNSFAATFGGKRAAACIVIPKNSPMSTELKLPFGVSFTATYESDGIKGVFKLIGSEDAILSSIFHLVADKKWRLDAMEKMFGSQEPAEYSYDSYETYAEEPDYYEYVEEAPVSEY